MKLNNLKKMFKFDTSVIYYLSSFYVNINVVCFETNHFNGLIYILTHIA